MDLSDRLAHRHGRRGRLGAARLPGVWPSPQESPGGRFHLQPDAPGARRIRHQFRAQRPSRPVLPEPAGGRRLSSRPALRLRGLHPTQHVGRHGAVLWWRVDNIDVADRGRAGGGIRDKQDLPAWGRLDANFRLVPAVICNEFVFVAGQMAHNPGTGLDPRVIVPDHAAWAGIPIRQQTEFLIVEKLKPALEAAGSSLEQSVKAQIYLAEIADMPDCLDVWSRYYAGIPCAITVVPTKSFATAGGIIEINLIALTNGAIRQKEVVDANIPGMAAFGPSLKVGEFLLPSGLMAIGRDGHIAGSIVSSNFPWFGARRIQPGRGGLWLCRGAVPGCRNDNGPSTAR